MYGYQPVVKDATPKGGVGGKGGANQWRSVVEAVLRELGLSLRFTGHVLKAIQKESGGNPRATNNWDINAKNGDPSKGLLQVIGSTFNAYAGKYKNRGQY